MSNGAIGNAPGHGAVVGLQKSYLMSSVQENLFVAGKAFSYEDYHEFTSNEEKIFVFDSGAYPGENLAFLPINFYASSGPILIEFYTNVTAGNDGTLLQATNRREAFPPPVSILRLNPTGFSGLRFAGDMVPAVGVAPAAGTGEHNEANVLGVPFELIAGVKHALKITNLNGNGVYVQIKMTWFEV